MVVKASRTDSADSGFHGPAAGFGDDDFNPDLDDKAAVLACRIAWNDLLADGNKRAAWACLVMFIEPQRRALTPPEPPEVEASVTAMLAVAAREVDEEQFDRWLRDRVVFDR